MTGDLYKTRAMNRTPTPLPICLEMLYHTTHKATQMLSCGKYFGALIVSSGERSIHSSIVVMGRSDSRNDGEDGWTYISGGCYWSKETRRKSLGPTVIYFAIAIALEYTDYIYIYIYIYTNAYRINTYHKFYFGSWDHNVWYDSRCFNDEYHVTKAKHH